MERTDMSGSHGEADGLNKSLSMKPGKQTYVQPDAVRHKKTTEN